MLLTHVRRCFSLASVLSTRRLLAGYRRQRVSSSSVRSCNTDQQGSVFRTTFILHCNNSTNSRLRSSGWPRDYDRSPAQIRLNSSLLNAPPTIFIYTFAQPQPIHSKSLIQANPVERKTLSNKTWNYTNVVFTDQKGRQRVNRWSRPSPSSRWHLTIHHPAVPFRIVRRGRWLTQGGYDAAAAGQIHRGVVKMEGFLVPRFQRCASIDRHGSTARAVIVGPRAGSRESLRPRRAHDQHHCDE